MNANNLPRGSMPLANPMHLSNSSINSNIKNQNINNTLGNSTNNSIVSRKQNNIQNKTILTGGNSLEKMKNSINSSLNNNQNVIQNSKTVFRKTNPPVYKNIIIKPGKVTSSGSLLISSRASKFNRVIRDGKRIRNIDMNNDCEDTQNEDTESIASSNINKKNELDVKSSNAERIISSQFIKSGINDSTLEKNGNKDKTLIRSNSDVANKNLKSNSITKIANKIQKGKNDPLDTDETSSVINDNNSSLNQSLEINQRANIQNPNLANITIQPNNILNSNLINTINSTKKPIETLNQSNANINQKNQSIQIRQTNPLITIGQNNPPININQINPALIINQNNPNIHIGQNISNQLPINLQNISPLVLNKNLQIVNANNQITQLSYNKNNQLSQLPNNINNKQLSQLPNNINNNKQLNQLPNNINNNNQLNQLSNNININNQLNQLSNNINNNNQSKININLNDKKNQRGSKRDDDAKSRKSESKASNNNFPVQPVNYKSNSPQIKMDGNPNVNTIPQIASPTPESIPSPTPDSKSSPPVASQNDNYLIAHLDEYIQQETQPQAIPLEEILNEKKGSGFRLCSQLSQAGKNVEGKTKICQDTPLISLNVGGYVGFNLFGVLDGHGPHGHFISKFCKDYIIKNMENYTESLKLTIGISTADELYQELKNNNFNYIIELYQNADIDLMSQNNFDYELSGTTCNIVFQFNKHLVCVNVGDSRAILIYDKGDYSNQGIFPLSRDHKPNLPGELERIQISGGAIDKTTDIYGNKSGPLRVYKAGYNYPGLAMSRSIGDLKAKEVGVIATPDIIEYTITPNSKYFTICSDGVWEFVSNEQVRDIGNVFYQQNDITGFCEDIVRYSMRIWSQSATIRDDITCVGVFL